MLYSGFTAMTISFFQGHTKDGCPYSISIIQGAGGGAASGTIHMKDGLRVSLPALTAKQGAQFLKTLPDANVSEVVKLLDGYKVN